MKNILFFIFLSSFNLFSYDLPKSCYGKYEGEMIKYKAVINDIEFEVDSHFVQIIIHPNELYYNFGLLKISGAYTVSKITSEYYSIKAILNNNKNIKFDLDIILNKKTGILQIKNHNQEPEVLLKRVSITKSKYLRLMPS